MTWILIASTAYVVTTLLTVLVLRWHLLRMREEVKQVAERLVQELIAEGKQKVRSAATEAAGKWLGQRVRSPGTYLES